MSVNLNLALAAPFFAPSGPVQAPQRRARLFQITSTAVTNIFSVSGAFGVTEDSFYVHDPFSSNVRVLSKTDGSRTSTFSVPVRPTGGFNIQDNRLWTVDANTRSVLNTFALDGTDRKQYQRLVSAINRDAGDVAPFGDRLLWAGEVPFTFAFQIRVGNVSDLVLNATGTQWAGSPAVGRTGGGFSPRSMVADGESELFWFTADGSTLTVYDFSGSFARQVGSWRPSQDTTDSFSNIRALGFGEGQLFALDTSNWMHQIDINQRAAN